MARKRLRIVEVNGVREVWSMADEDFDRNVEQAIADGIKVKVIR